MNIDKAIEHAFEVSTTCESASCALEHVQLAFWLKQLKELQSILGYSYNLDRLKELADADKEGRCLVLPCKVGDTVYICYYSFYSRTLETSEYTIYGIEINEKGITYQAEMWKTKDKYSPQERFEYWFDINDIGRSVFLTKQDSQILVDKRKNN